MPSSPGQVNNDPLTTIDRGRPEQPLAETLCLVLEPAFFAELIFFRRNLSERVNTRFVVDADEAR